MRLTAMAQSKAITSALETGLPTTRQYGRSQLTPLKKNLLSSSADCSIKLWNFTEEDNEFMKECVGTCKQIYDYNYQYLGGVEYNENMSSILLLSSQLMHTDSFFFYISLSLILKCFKSMLFFKSNFNYKSYSLFFT
jgi:WD40 repeat protein